MASATHTKNTTRTPTTMPTIFLTESGYKKNNDCVKSYKILIRISYIIIKVQKLLVKKDNSIKSCMGVELL